MVKNPIIRAAKYNVKIDATVIKQRFEGLKTMMVEQVTTRFSDLAALEENAKAILDANNVPSIEVPFYLSFVRQLYRIVNTHPGTTAVTEAKLYKKVWVGRGLTATILETLASSLFGLDITEPSP